MDKKFCNFYLVRHGETDWNKEKKLQGSTDIPLNDCGREQARILKQQFGDLNFDSIHSSDLIRAKETAEIISHGKNLQVITSPKLRERSWGSHEGANFDVLRAKYGKSFLPVIEDFEPDLKEMHPDLYEVESYSKNIERVMQYLMEIQIVSSGKNILVVSHGGVLKGMLLYLKLQEYKNPYVHNTAYLHLEAHDNHLVFKAAQGVLNHT